MILTPRPGGNGVWGHTTVEKGSGVVGSVDPNLSQAAGVTGAMRAGRLEGDVEVTGAITVDGDVFLKNRDVAEQFGAVGECAPGSVMVVGENGLLQPCTCDYDKRAIGIISGAGSLRPAITLGQSESDAPSVSIAMVGTAFCLVDAEKSPIAVGDVLTSLKADLSAQPPLPEAARLQQIQQCLEAVNLLNNDDKWLTNFFDEIYYNDPWSGDIKPDHDPDGLAFSKRFILPQFLRVLFILNGVGMALESDFLIKFRDALEDPEGFIARLQKVYDISVDGIVPVRTPEREELFIGSPGGTEYFGFEDSEGRAFLANKWGTDITRNTSPDFFQMYGAVDKYSGFNSVSNFPPIPMPDGNRPRMTSSSPNFSLVIALVPTSM